MRLKLIFNHSEKSFITLPCHYNEIIQGFIYRNLDSWLSEKIHEQGFKDPETERKLKFFTFSRLIPDEKAYVRDGKINLYGNVKLIVSSPIKDFIQSFAMNLMKAGTLRLGKEDLVLSYVEGEVIGQWGALHVLFGLRAY